ncbi:MAG: DNA repair protein RadA [Rickettsiales bacterium]|nr:DNA repair protein RadA [Rickettsiales bacterium]|tara:strand:+ start:14964 stop:16376 length:1413 start_codon:yes stop_codon:yes gene_type:complete
MAKKTAYSCQSCGAIHFKWSGKCPDCGAWNSLVEEYGEGGGSHFTRITKENNNKNNHTPKLKLTKISENINDFKRISTSINELDRVLGGGLVQGSVILIGGSPGIGKSTLLLQTASKLSQSKNKVIYISGEESIDQVSLRAKRMNVAQNNIELGSTTNINEIINSITDDKNQDQQIIMIIDSIQTMFIEELSSAPGSVSQVRAAAGELTIFAKKNNITLLIVSHITKDGQIAGPKVLEHMVDTVLYFEGEKDLHFRILRANKNRFGPANEIGVFEMNEYGLSEVLNPSELFLNSYEIDTSGCAIFAGIEGTRPILIEVQALISPSYMPSPRRAVVGWDSNRLAMIIAVLNNRFGLNLFDKEVYLNIVGGLKIEETAADLAIACALISAAKDKVIAKSTIAIGEIGLTGEVRMVGNLENRIKEAQKLGFKNCLIPAANTKNKNWNNIKKSLPDINFIAISHIRDLMKIFRS